jgi:hypothetical protein
VIWSSSRVEGDDARIAAALSSTEGTPDRVALAVLDMYSVTFEYCGGRISVTNK